MVRCKRWLILAMAILGLAVICASATSAQVFTAPKNVTNNQDYSFTPQVAVDGSGNINMVWEDDTATNSNILFSRSTDGGATFSAAKNLSNSPGFSFNPRIAVDSSGGINVVWEDNTPGNLDVFFSRSTDNGATFSRPANLSNDPADSANPQIAVDGGGSISVAWESDSVSLGILFTHSTDGGATFSMPVDLATNTSGSISPQLAVDLAGNINVAWEDDIAGSSNISFSSSADKGMTFSPPKSLTNNLGNSTSAQLAVDLAGNINIVWTNDSPGNFDIFFTRSTDKGMTFSAPKNVSKGTGMATGPQIGTDTGGNIYVVWSDNTPPNSSPDIFFSRSSDGGMTFSTPQNLSNDPGFSTNSFLAVDAGGGINVSWEDTTPGNSDIFFTRSSDGGMTFSAPQNLSNDPGLSTEVQVAVDKNGNINVVWADSTPGVSQIFFSRDPASKPANQPPVADAGHDQNFSCAGPAGVLVTLDGSKSSDPDGDSLSFQWMDEANNVVGNAAVVQLRLSAGVHSFTLTVTDAGGLTSKATTHVTILQAPAPTLQVSLSPNVLWPANNRLVLINATVQASSSCDAGPTVQLVSITSNDLDDEHQSNDIQAVGGGPVRFGTDVRSFMLRAERPEMRVPRAYTVTYCVHDAFDNASLASAQVVVRGGDAHRRRKRADKDEERER